MLSLAKSDRDLIELLQCVQHQRGVRSPPCERGQDEVRTGVHRVTRVERQRHTDQAPYGRPVPALLTGVLNVVVNEGEVVQQLDRGCDGNRHHDVTACSRT